MARDKNSLTTEQLMAAAIEGLKTMSPEEKARARAILDADLQRMRAQRAVLLADLHCLRRRYLQ
jgi:hypothetical protein